MNVETTRPASAGQAIKKDRHATLQASNAGLPSVHPLGEKRVFSWFAFSVCARFVADARLGPLPRIGCCVRRTQYPVPTPLETTLPRQTQRLLTLRETRIEVLVEAENEYPLSGVRANVRVHRKDLRPRGLLHDPC